MNTGLGERVVPQGATTTVVDAVVNTGTRLLLRTLLRELHEVNAE